MALTIVATPGAANANSYLTAVEDSAYQESRLWADAGAAYGDDQLKAIIMATRLIDAHFSWAGVDAAIAKGERIARAWTGMASTATQALCWPRTGMYNRNGYAIASGEVPQALKNAVSELAHQLVVGDRTLDSEISVQGITSLRAGPVSLSFKDTIEAKVIPDAVVALLVPSWYTNVVDSGADFEVL